MGRVFILIQTNSNCNNEVKIKKELEQSIIRKLHGANVYRIIMMSFIGSILLLSTILLQVCTRLEYQNAWKLETIFLVFRPPTMIARQLEGQELAYQTEFVLVFVLGDHLDQQARKLQQDPQVLKDILEISDQPDLKESKVQHRQQVQPGWN